MGKIVEMLFLIMLINDLDWVENSQNLCFALFMIDLKDFRVAVPDLEEGKEEEVFTYRSKTFHLYETY